MSRPSRSKSPVAALRRLLGQKHEVTLEHFAKRHAIPIDTLKKIESKKSKQRLSPERADEIAARYGLNARSLLKKTGEPLALDGTKATSESVRMWEEIYAKIPTKQIATHAARLIHAMFLSASDTPHAAVLAQRFMRFIDDQETTIPQLRHILKMRRQEWSPSSEKPIARVKEIFGKHKGWLAMERVWKSKQTLPLSYRRIPGPLIEFRNLPKRDPSAPDRLGIAKTQMIVTGKVRIEHQTRLRVDRHDVEFGIIHERATVLMQTDGRTKVIPVRVIIPVYDFTD